VEYYTAIGRPPFRPGPEFGPCVYRRSSIDDGDRTMCFYTKSASGLDPHQPFMLVQMQWLLADVDS